MAKKSSKTTKTQKQIPYDPKPILRHPSTWIAAVLLFALLFIYGLSMYGLKHSATLTKLDSAELATFSHLAKMYIKDMEFDVNGQPTTKQATGYGVSDQDDVLYVTFDFVPYVVEDNNRIPKAKCAMVSSIFSGMPNVTPTATLSATTMMPPIIQQALMSNSKIISRDNPL